MKKKELKRLVAELNQEIILIKEDIARLSIQADESVVEARLRRPPDLKRPAESVWLMSRGDARYLGGEIVSQRWERRDAAADDKEGS